MQYIFIVTYSQAIFSTINFIAFDFIMLSDINSNPNNPIEILFISVFIVNCLMCLSISLIIDTSKNIKVFFVGIKLPE